MTIFSFHYKNGLQFTFPNSKYLVIDATNSKVPVRAESIVSHAHSDHFSIMNSPINTYATQETIDLFLCQKQPKTTEFFHPVPFNKKIVLKQEISDLNVQLIPSGHILGAASVLLEQNNNRILFTSDIGGNGLLTVKGPSQKESANILVIEATFGSPEITFPPREEISMDILKWTADNIKEKKNVVLSAGKIGSAQELIKLYNDFTSLRVVTHGDVTPPTEIYKKYNVKLESFDSKSPEGREIIKDGEAVIIQSRSKKIIPYFMKEHVKCSSAIVTGMATRFSYKDFDAAFPLSSHANYPEIIEYISEVNPEMVFTLYGYDKRLAKAIKSEINIPALPLKEKDVLNSKEKLSELSYQKDKHLYTKHKTKEILEKEQSKVQLKKEKTLDDFF